MMRLDLAEIANSIWEIFQDDVPRKKADRLVLADRLVDYIVSNPSDYDGYADIACYAEYDDLATAAQNNMKRIKEERNEAAGLTNTTQPGS